MRGFPSPLEHPLPPVTHAGREPRGAARVRPRGPLVAEVVKTTTDPYVGRLSLVRVFSGSWCPTPPCTCPATSPGSRGPSAATPTTTWTSVSAPCPWSLGATLAPLAKGVAGDIVAVARLGRAETGDTLSAPVAPALMEPWLMPEPLLPVAVTARTSTDEDKLSQGLGGWSPRTPRSGWSRTPTPGRWCCGRWVRPISKCCSTG